MKIFIIIFNIFTAAICCQLRDFLPCIMQLNTQKVEFQLNPIDVIFNISTEAKLIHTCRTYGRVFPCFDQKVSSCGTAADKLQLSQSKRVHSYLCSPFSLQRQKTFLRSTKCVREILNKPTESDCNRDGTNYSDKLNSCREQCFNKKCEEDIEKSKISTCTLIKIENNCSREAADFFSQLQRVLTNKEYPVQCKYDIRQKFQGLKNGLPIESLKPTTTTESNLFVTIHPPAETQNGLLTRTSLPIKHQTDSTARIKSRPSFSTAKPFIQTMFVDEKGSPLSALNVADSSKTVHKFIPNTYTSKNSNSMPQLNVRTTRITNDAQISEHHYTTWSYKPLGESTIAPIISKYYLKPTETVLSPPPVNFNFKLPNEQTSTQPFKVEINWMDDNEKSSTEASKTITPWYVPTIRISEDSPSEKAHTIVVNPTFEQIKSQPLNLTELSNQANNYFSAALNAFSETKKEMEQSDPWRTIIDAVAPTIHRVSPDIIPRIREEINRIQPEHN